MHFYLAVFKFTHHVLHHSEIELTLNWRRDISDSVIVNFVINRRVFCEQTDG